MVGFVGWNSSLTVIKLFEETVYLLMKFQKEQNEKQILSNYFAGNWQLQKHGPATLGFGNNTKQTSKGHLFL